MSVLDEALAVGRARRTLPPPAIRRHIRESAGVSQRQLAAELGVNASQVNRWEHGGRTPRGRNALAYARALERMTRETVA